MPTSFTSKLTRIRSVKLPFKKPHSTTGTDTNANTTTTTTTTTSNAFTENPYDSNNLEPNLYNTPEPTTYPNPMPAVTTSFAETLRVISKEANRTQFDDVFDSFFFNDRRCQHRALFMAARLKQALDSVIHPHRPTSSYSLRDPPAMTTTLSPSQSTPITSSTLSKPSHDNSKPPSASVDSFWRTVTHRLYTLNYILFVLPADSQSRAQFLQHMESDIAKQSDGGELQRRGGMEAHFAVRYALEHRRPRRRKTLLEDAFEEEKRKGGSVAGAILPSTSSTTTDLCSTQGDQIVERARRVIEQCLESESKLGHAEKDAMYVLHAMRAGLYETFDLHIELEEDRALRHRLKRTVDHNRESAKPAYENPFEDENLIVTEEDEDDSLSDKPPSREVDSGFYDDWANNHALSTSSS